MLHSPGEDEIPSMVCSLRVGGVCDEFLAQGKRTGAGWICTQTRCRLTCWLPRILSLVHTSAGATNLAYVSCPFCSALFLVMVATENWKSVSGSGDRSAEEARSLPPVGTCHDSRCHEEETHMVHALTSDASLLVDQAVQNSSHRTSLDMKCSGLGPNTW